MDDRQRGTIIVVRHKGRPYSHYGILDGNHGVIHVNKRKSSITIDPLEKVLKNAVTMSIIEEDDETRLRNWQRAIIQVGSAYNYGLSSNNCESWVNEIRFGDSISKQIEKVADYTVLLSLFLL